jgi:hypothetical protein
MACWPASYLTFAASYRNRNEKQKASANSGESYPYCRYIRVVMLAAMPLCTDGNPHALRRAFQPRLLPEVKRSMINLINCMTPQVISGIRKSGMRVVTTS